MNRKRLKPILTGAAIAIILFAANWIMGAVTGCIIGISFWGGEVCTYMGFGVMLNQFYPLAPLESPVEGGASLGFDLVSFIVTLLICCGIAWAVQVRRERKKNIKE